MTDLLTSGQYVEGLSNGLFLPRGEAVAETRFIAVNGVPIKLCFMAENAVLSVMPAFAHLEREPAGEILLTVVIGDRGTSGDLMARSPWRGQIEECRDRLLMVNHESFHMQYNPDSTILSLVDTDAEVAYYYADDFEAVPSYEKSAPLKFILHWFCEKHGMCLVHAAAVGVDGAGVLLVGRGGSGKSTTAVSAAVHGLEYAGDDYVVLGRSPELCAAGIYCSAKVNDDVLARLPELHPHVTNPGRGEDEKALVFLSEGFGPVCVGRIPLKAIVATRLSGGEASLKKSPPLPIFAEIASSTIFQMPGSGARTLSVLKGVFGELPVYSLELSGDFASNARVLGDFCAGLNGHG